MTKIDLQKLKKARLENDKQMKLLKARIQEVLELIAKCYECRADGVRKPEPHRIHDPWPGPYDCRYFNLSHIGKKDQCIFYETSFSGELSYWASSFTSSFPMAWLTMPDAKIQEIVNQRAKPIVQKAKDAVEKKKAALARLSPEDRKAIFTETWMAAKPETKGI